MAKGKRKLILGRRLTIKDLGDVSAINKKKEGDTIDLGTIIGKVIGKKVKPDRFDPQRESIGFIGVFRGEPEDQSRPIVQAQVLYLPDFYAQNLSAALDKAGDGAEIPFYCKVQVTKTAKQGKGKNAGQGYRYDLALETERGGADPLAAIYDQFNVEKPLLLEGPKTGKKKAAK